MKKTKKTSLESYIDSLPDNLSASEIKNRIKEKFSNPKTKMVWKSPKGKITMTFSLFSMVITLLIVTKVIPLGEQFQKPIHIDILLYTCWVLLPPIWFLVEYVWLFHDEYKEDERQVADMKYTQELASKIWAGMIVVITAILYAKYGPNKINF